MEIEVSSNTYASLDPDHDPERWSSPDLDHVPERQIMEKGSHLQLLKAFQKDSHFQILQSQSSLDPNSMINSILAEANSFPPISPIKTPPKKRDN